MTRACSRNASSPSFRLIELTTPFPWRHLSPASKTDQRELSTMIGMRATSGSVASRFRKVGVHVDIEDVRAATHLLERHLHRLLEVPCLDQTPEARGARDVRPLSDHYEVRARENSERFQST